MQIFTGVVEQLNRIGYEWIGAVVDAFNTVRFDAENIGVLVGVGVVGKILYMYVSLDL